MLTSLYFCRQLLSFDDEIQVYTTTNLVFGQYVREEFVLIMESHKLAKPST